MKLKFEVGFEVEVQIQFQPSNFNFGGWVVGESDFKENPMYDLDLDLGFVNNDQ